MSDGTNVLSEVDYNDSTYSYRFTMPVMYTTIAIPGGEEIIAAPYLPGAADNVLEIPSNAIVTMASANDFFTRFYGSSLMKLYIQNELQANALKGSEELDKDVILRLKLKKEEIMEKFGMIEETQLENPNKGLLH